MRLPRKGALDRPLPMRVRVSPRHIGRAGRRFRSAKGCEKMGPSVVASEFAISGTTATILRLSRITGAV
jgi:hypothetical protein